MTTSRVNAELLQAELDTARFRIAGFERESHALSATLELARSCATLSADADVARFVSDQCMHICKAEAVVLWVYDPEHSSLIVEQTTLPRSFVLRLERMTGHVLGRNSVRLELAEVAAMVSDTATSVDGLSTATFGLLSAHVATVLKRTYRLGPATLLSLTYGGQLLGFISIFMRADVSAPDREVTASVSSIAAIALRAARADSVQPRNDERYRLAFENSPDAMFLTDVNCSILAANATARTMFGRSNDELRAIGLRGVIDQSDANFAEVVEEVKQSRRFSGDFIFLDKDGKRFAGFAACAGFADFNGHSSAIVAVRGAAGKSTAADSLVASATRYRELVDSSLVGVYQTTIDGEIVFANESLVRMFGCASVDELTSFSADRFYRDPADRRQIVRLLQQKGQLSEFEYDFILLDGTVKTVLGGATLAGNIISGIAIDITDRKRSEIELRNTQRRLEQLSHRLLESQENERRAIARELHDEIGQVLTVAKIDLQTIQAGGDAERLARRLDENIDILDRCLMQVRNLSFDLRPPILDDLGLLPALRWQTQRHALRGNFTVQIVADDIPHRLDSDLETVSFRIVQEALTNIARHAQARNVEVTIRILGEELKLTIQDDGNGFDVKDLTLRANHGQTFGVMSMQGRAELLNGRFSIESEIAHGTKVTASLPLRFSERA